MDPAAVGVVGADVLVAAGLGWWFFGPKPTADTAVTSGVQEVRVTVRGGYNPNRIRAKAGVPLRLVFDRQESGDCTSRVVFPDFGASAELPAFGEATLELVPDAPGEYGFACGMNMIHGTLVVERARAGEPARTAAAGTSDAHASTGAVADLDAADLDHIDLDATRARSDGAGPVGAVVIDSGSHPTRARSTAGAPVVVPPVVRDGSARPSAHDDAEDQKAAQHRAEIVDLSRRVIVGAVLTVPVLFAVMAEDFFHVGWLPSVLTDPWFGLATIAPVFAYTGWPIHRSGWLGLAHRSADMNSLVTLGATAAFLYSVLVTIVPSFAPAKVRGVYYEEVGFILTLILLGRLFEVRAKAGTGEAIRALLGLQARTARVVRHGVESELAIDDVVPGDVVIVRPGEKIPVDGDVLEGHSAARSFAK